MPDGVTTKLVGLGGINVAINRLRALRPETVEKLAASMKINGLLQPIVLRPRGTAGYWLVAGRHRFEAARKLKWDSIQARIFDDLDADQAELAEIDENLVRAELSPAERAMHVGRRKQLYEKEHGKAKAIGGSASQRKQGHKANAKLADAFTADTAKKTGKSSRAVQRDTTRSERVKVLSDITVQPSTRAMNSTRWPNCPKPSNASWSRASRPATRSLPRPASNALTVSLSWQNPQLQPPPPLDWRSRRQ